MEKKLYYSIGEVSEELGVAPSVLRFWESQFSQIKPVKNKRGARSYTERDIELLRRIHYLTRHCGYTLEGARERLHASPDADPSALLLSHLTELRAFLLSLKEQL